MCECDLVDFHAYALLHIQKDPHLLPGNIAKKNIGDLQECWICTKPDSTCPSTHCFVCESGEHLPLSHQHMDAWASAIVCDKSLSVSFDAYAVVRLVMMVGLLFCSHHVINYS